VPLCMPSIKCVVFQQRNAAQHVQLRLQVVFAPSTDLKALPIQGKVLVDDTPVFKVGTLISPAADLRIKGAPCRFASRCTRVRSQSLVVRICWLRSVSTPRRPGGT